MTEVMLHLDHPLDPDHQARLRETLHGYGAEITEHSSKPHLVFVRYEEDRTAPHDLVAAAEHAGLSAQVVDL